MPELNGVPENIDDKLYTLKYNPDDKPHLIPDMEICKKCPNKDCSIVCPASVYEWDDDKKELIVGFENCLECGACRIACPAKTLLWEYPSSGKGVTFKYG